MVPARTGPTTAEGCGATAADPRHPSEIAALIRKMAAANPLWGAPRIHGESSSSLESRFPSAPSRLMPKRRFGPPQTWLTFFANHLLDLVSIDFFTVPAAQFARPCCQSLPGTH
jgi:hypothetical protein